ncbi:hypothetical protein A2V54_01380 [candidate division WWE3 bacterium RBG_19FT_COMBO_53_11]|uniref:Uncharacterized protein n=1 Tax=candidate division WWE3 bacterium RBG_19FT_COMBO_53_11 TaxID=1802613 RepID=A0A1F4UJ23_UNCKA|nr:MAG: hypothetical protein A2V54_01380 [candidate division WWE3 bacterium RBG_19FT_COMBO_53_11]
MKISGALLGAGIVLAVIVVLGLAVFGYANGIWNEGIPMERTLSAQYLANQNYLSQYISGFYEQSSVAIVKTDAIDRIMMDAVKGRYEDGGYNVDSAFFAVMVEAYPDLGQNMEIYDKIVDYIQANRAGYGAMQEKLLDQLRVYDTWRETGLIRRYIVRLVGFPSENLEARIGEMVYRGEAARDRMYTIVLTADALKAYESGTMDPLQMPDK